MTSTRRAFPYGSGLRTPHSQRDGRARPHQHGQDPPGHRAHAGSPVGADRLAAAPAGTGGVRPDRCTRRRRCRCPHHGRGEDQARAGALLCVHGRGDAARAQRRFPGHRRGAAGRRPRARSRFHGPAAARTRVARDASARRPDDARDHRRPDPRRQLHLQAATVEAHLLGREEDHPSARAYGDRRVLGRRGLRRRRADPAPARRCGSRAWCAQPAHAQRAGRPLSVGGCRFSRRHRRDRHGAQPGGRACGVCGRAQVRRPGASRPHPGRARPDRGPRRPPHEQRHVRSDGQRAAVLGRHHRAAGVAHLRQRQGAAVAYARARLRLARSPARQPARGPARDAPDTRAHGGRHGGAGERQPRSRA